MKGTAFLPNGNDRSNKKLQYTGPQKKKTLYSQEQEEMLNPQEKEKQDLE